MHPDGIKRASSASLFAFNTHDSTLRTHSHTYLGLIALQEVESFVVLVRFFVRVFCLLFCENVLKTVLRVVVMDIRAGRRAIKWLTKVSFNNSKLVHDNIHKSSIRISPWHGMACMHFSITARHTP